MNPWSEAAWYQHTWSTLSPVFEIARTLRAHADAEQERRKYIMEGLCLANKRYPIPEDFRWLIAACLERVDSRQSSAYLASGGGTPHMRLLRRRRRVRLGQDVMPREGQECLVAGHITSSNHVREGGGMISVHDFVGGDVHRLVNAHARVLF
jgi:hypothetical protein